MVTTNRMEFGKLRISPSLSPGILDTGTWNRPAAVAALQAVDGAYWAALLQAAANGAPLPATPGLTPYPASIAWRDGSFYCLAGLRDGQQVFLELGPRTPHSPLGELLLLEPVRAAVTGAATLDRFFRHVAPERGPRALGPIPRLGVGTRMTTAVWPAIWEAMNQGGFAANAIQNSVRELNFLQTLLEGQPAERNVAFGFGTIETGYTGSSYEGLWVSGALNALAHGASGRYGADADHIQVKRGADGLARAKRLLDATRYYSFYTLDVSDVLDYSALSGGAPEAASGPATPPQNHRSDWLLYHREPRRVGGFDYAPDDAALARLAAKYWVALDAVGLLYDYICDLKGDVPFDLELSIDEHPNDVPTFECLTTETELAFVLLEAQRRGIPLTHVAPNFGVEKGTDYRGSDGMPGFEARCRRLWQIAEDFGVMTDFHSGDDLSAASRQAIGAATGGRNHFKVSPNLQLLFGDVLARHHPDLFRRWWNDALAYAQREAAAGSQFAATCIAKSDLQSPSSHDEIFHHFSFAFVGRRDAGGQFICREEFYDLSPAFYEAYKQCIVAYLLELARDLRM